LYDADVELPSDRSRESQADARFAMRLSLAFGFLMFAGKVGAYLYTGSPAIFSDAAESLIHVAAVGFAAFSLRLSAKPADERFRYGYERISFFSAGFEGALIILAAVSILFAAIYKWIAGLETQHLGYGTLIVLSAAIVNAALGWYLIRTGKRTNSLILEANGKHVLTDSWTSFGVVGGLCLVLLTGWKPFDPIFAIAVALNILWSGWQLVWRSARGLMDYSDPELGKLLRQELDDICEKLGIGYHGLRFRSTGHRTIVELHLIFPFATPLGEAHRQATAIEGRLEAMFKSPIEVVTHLESLEDHGKVHHDHH
jgi:cation diffusion facilitator family transporter